MNVLRTHPMLQVAVGVALLVLIAALAVVAPLGALFATIFGVIYGTVAMTAHLQPATAAGAVPATAPARDNESTGTSSMGIL